ncbi:hypothetical protein DKW60_22045 [Leucothrix pacifica]|uniref:Uncharacterized protein n=2 Tax=Leucothrix pacifica TaxID=1247513 RepID=A0A317C0T1_9GAMM|nr:hypothetical protein DKW60_22045 [Leucothrix pacifica]
MNKLFILFVVAIIFGCVSVKAEGECDCHYKSMVEIVSGVSREDWQNENREKDADKVIWDTKKGIMIPDEDIYFVKVNKIPLAVIALKSDDTVLLTDDLAKNYAGKYLQKKNKKNGLYLVRAMFENLTGSDFNIHWYPDDKILKVSYFSLGPSGGKFFSPLVVSLPDRPEKVVLEFGGAI